MSHKVDPLSKITIRLHVKEQSVKPILKECPENHAQYKQPDKQAYGKLILEQSQVNEIPDKWHEYQRNNSNMNARKEIEKSILKHLWAFVLVVHELFFCHGAKVINRPSWAVLSRLIFINMIILLDR